MNKIAEEEDEEDTKVTKGIPTKGQKPKASKTASGDGTVRKSSRVQQFKPQDIVGKAVEIKWDNEGALTVEAVKDRGEKGQFYKAKVSSYNPDTYLHKVQYVRDGVIAEHNFSNPKKPGFIARGFWKIATK